MGFSELPSKVVLTTTILGLFSRLLEESKSGKQALREVCPLIAGSTSRGTTITNDLHRSSGPLRSVCSACFWSRECDFPSAPLLGLQAVSLTNLFWRRTGGTSDRRRVWSQDVHRGWRYLFGNQDSRIRNTGPSFFVCAWSYRRRLLFFAIPRALNGSDLRTPAMPVGGVVSGSSR